MFYTQELQIVLFTFIMIGQQYYATWAYRKYVSGKTIQSKWLHRFNALIAGFLIGVLAMSFKSWIEIGFFVICSGLIYNALLDTGYSLTITKFKNAWYLGGEAKTDEEFKHLLGKNEGRTKFIIEIVILIGLNLAYKLMLK